jgi:sugar phosphate permease
MIFDIPFWAFQSWLPTYLVQARGFSMAEMAAATSLPFLAGAVGRIVGGWLSDGAFRNRRRFLVALTQVISAITLLLAFLSPTTTSLVIFQTLSGFFLSMFLSAFWALPMNTLSKSRMGVASGFIQMGGTIGGIISPLCIGAILELSGNNFGAAGLFLEAAMIVSFIIVLRLPTPARVA